VERSNLILKKRLPQFTKKVNCPRTRIKRYNGKQEVATKKNRNISVSVFVF